MVNNTKSESLRQSLPPTILTIFGATGDLSADYLIPALLRMDDHGLLPKTFKLVCVGRRPFNSKSFLDFILKKSKVIKKMSAAKKKHFAKYLIYHQGDFEKIESFTELSKILKDQDSPNHVCYNRLFYFATSPQQFASLTQILKQTGLLTSCQDHERKVRVLVEKPFGFNLKSAQALNTLLLKYFTEDQIYRIDHYVGKETVQNLMVVRFANSLFEPLWNSKYIDHIQLNVLYDDKVGTRTEYFDISGSLKDIVQNHALQMLALIAMDEPKDMTSKLIRDEKAKVLNALTPFTSESLKTDFLKAQYQSYQKEINRSSKTETFVAFKTFINNERWNGVPFYIRTGMALTKKITEISIHFKEPTRCLFEGCSANVLTFQIQPDESVHLQINNKIPGMGVKLHQGDLDFSYKHAFKSEIPGAYERLLLDFLEGDQRLFIRSDEIEAAWNFVDSITENPEFKNLPLYSYKPGSGGPKESEEFMEKELKEWWTR